MSNLIRITLLIGLSKVCFVKSFECVLVYFADVGFGDNYA